MSKHTTHDPAQEIPYGYCHCGCGQKTNIAQGTDRRRGWIKGEPLRFVFGHQHRKPDDSQITNPSGSCLCGCGEKTKLALVTDRGRGWVKGQPLRYIDGHQNRKPSPPPRQFCACGCGQLLNQPSVPSQHREFISGHTNRQPVEPRFWAKINKRGPNECWEWTGSTGNHGYGTLSVDGSPQLVHRLSWQMANGPIPDGLHVLHKCDNRRCVNPAHLFLGTNQDNIRDKVDKGRQHHPKGAKGESNVTARLTTADVLDIRRRAMMGESQYQIAKQYGVSQGHISSIVRRITWKHI